MGRLRSQAVHPRPWPTPIHAGRPMAPAWRSCGPPARRRIRPRWRSCLPPAARQRSITDLCPRRQGSGVVAGWIHAGRDRRHVGRGVGQISTTTSAPSDPAGSMPSGTASTPPDGSTIARPTSTWSTPMVEMHPTAPHRGTVAPRRHRLAPRRSGRCRCSAPGMRSDTSIPVPRPGRSPVDGSGETAMVDLGMWGHVSYDRAGTAACGGCRGRVGLPRCQRAVPAVR